MKTPRKGKSFFVHVSEGQCPCCNWSATTKPVTVGENGWYVVDSLGANKFIGCDSSKHRMSEFYKHFGIFPKAGEQVEVQLVEVVRKRK